MAKIRYENSGICILQNLYQSFNAPNGYFFIYREDLEKCILKSDNIIHIVRENWEKVLYSITEQDVRNLGL